jgi:hypothetical protein
VTRDEYIATFKNYLAHPFGGNGAPSHAQMGPLFDAFLQLDPPPPWKAKKGPVGSRGGTRLHQKWLPSWDEDALAILRVACFMHASLEATAVALGRTPMNVLKQAFKLRPKIIPVVWAKAYGKYENR